jgi:glycosyltransferase involved in cell wall biosynthesis
MPEKLRSKLLRVAGLAGDFFFFSDRRLRVIAQDVEVKSSCQAEMDCFHGFTPWVLTTPKRPYLAWSDCTFRDYMTVYHRREQFREQDLRRIELAEARWLRSARRVLFTSDWAARRAAKDYHLDDRQVRVLGVCGQIELPTGDAYMRGSDFAFVATNFEAKGGRTVLAAFREVRGRHPDATLTVVGDRPSDIESPAGVKFVGFLRKEVPAELERYREVLAHARTLVHPTQSDIAPLLAVEAGYFGCPVISSKRFAIPELVDDGRTGLLLDDPSQATAVAAAMSWMLEHDSEYRQMRQAAWTNAHDQHSKRRFEERLLSHVRDVISGEGQPAA